MTVRRRGRVIADPQEFEDTIVNYLEHIQEVNSDKLVTYDIMKGDAYDSREAALEAGVDPKHIKSEWEKVPVYDLVKPTLSGYCAFIGSSLSTYYTTAKRSEEYKEVDEWFRTILEAEVEQLLLNPMNRNSTGAFRVAVNRHGWSDKQEISHTGAQPVEIKWDIDESK